ncbi:MAG: ComEC/Rec2 family competence protein [Christensenellaceae bacterium]
MTDNKPKKKRIKSKNSIEFSFAKFISGVSFSLILLAVICVFGFDKISAVFHLHFGRHTKTVILEQNALKYSADYKNEFEIRFIDCGQAKSIFLLLPNGENMLVDCGEDDSCANYLKNLNVSTIDYLVITHSDADHVGGAKQVFEQFNVRYCYRTYQHYSGLSNLDSGINPSLNGYAFAEDGSQYYEFLLSLQNEGCKTVYFNKNTDIEITITNPDGTTDVCLIDFLTPVADSVEEIAYDSANAYSPLIMVSYLDTNILLTGDSDTENNEAEFLKYYSDELFKYDVDILDVAHHGSDDSTSLEFLKTVNPEIAVISCGLNNAYGLPSQTVLDNLFALNDCVVFRTDLNGTVLIKIDKNYHNDGIYYKIFVQNDNLPLL